MSFHQQRSPFHNWGPGPRFDNATQGAYTTSAGYSITHKTGGGANRLLLVGVHVLNNAASVTGLTYDGVTLEFVRADTSLFPQITEIWKLANPAQGNKTLSVTFSGSCDSILSAVGLWNCDQLSLDADAGSTGTGPPVTASITPVKDDCRVVGFISTTDTSIAFDSALSPYLLGSGAQGSAGVAGEGVVYPIGSTPLAWANVGGSNDWAISLISVKPPLASDFIPSDPFGMMGIYGV